MWNTLTQLILVIDIQAVIRAGAGDNLFEPFSADDLKAKVASVLVAASRGIGRIAPAAEPDLCPYFVSSLSEPAVVDRPCVGKPTFRGCEMIAKA